MSPVMPPAAFTTPLPLALSSPRAHGARRVLLCRSPAALRARTRMRTGPADAAPGPDAVPLGGSRDDPLGGNEDAGEMPPFVGGRKDPVPPAEFEDADDAANKGMAEKAGIQDDLLHGLEEGDLGEMMQRSAKDAAKAKDTVVKKTADAGKSVENEAAKPKVFVKRTADAGKSVVEKPAKKKDNVAEKAAAAAPEEVTGGTSLKMTPEQIERSKAARAAAAKAAEEKDAKKKASTKELLAKAQQLLVTIGTKTGTFALGQKARANAEVIVEDTIKLGESEKATQTDKVKSSAAGAAKAVVATVTKGWEDNVVPQVKEKLPEEYSSFTNKAFAAAAVGLFVAVALLPSLFSGGGQPAKETTNKKKLDTETAVLEKKLARDRSMSSSYSGSSRSAAQKGVFPPEEKLPSSIPKAREAPKSVAPSMKVAEVKKSESTADEATPSSVTVTSPKSAEPVPPPVKEVTPPKPQPLAEPMKQADVTPAIVMSSITKALGTKAVLVSSVSFDSLSSEPTVVLEVSKAYHRLPVVEQKQIAEKALKTTRMLGYERVSFIEADTGVQVAHAGVDIDLEDETENLRAEVGSLRKQNDKLAAQNANQEAQLDTTKTRLDDERDEFVAQRSELEQKIKNMQNENAGLIDDLAEAKEEIAKIPDRLALEERTLQAEKKSEKLTDTVEMLSSQLTKARADEARAKQVEVESLAAVKEANRVKSESLAAVAGQIEQAKAEAQRRATQEIAETQNDAKVAVEAANKRVVEVEDTMTAAQRQSSRMLEDTTKSYEQRLVEEAKAKTTEVKTIQDKYETMLEDIQRRAKADLDAFQKEADKKMQAAMKESRATADSLMKERDQALKETEKSEARSEKAATKAAREKENLQSKIAKLDAKLKGKAPAEPAPAPEVKQAVGAGN